MTKERKCNVVGCDIDYKSRGLCQRHYIQFYRGDTSLPANPSNRKGYGPTCEVIDCGKKRVWGAHCSMHSKRVQKYGTTDNPPRLTLEERFWPKVDKQGVDECWVWLASCGSGGYGQFNGWGRQTGAHRVSYYIAYGIKLKPQHQVHHTCANRLCVNPNHLQRVSPAENNAEMRERTFYKKRISYLEGLLKENGVIFGG